MELTNTNVRYLLTIYHLSQARLAQERNRRAEQRDVNLHVLADLRKSTFRKHRVNR